MSNPRSAFCLFCDDIRMEVGNKPSFMGIYGADMVFSPDLPKDMQIAVPKLAIVTWLFCDVDDKPQRMVLHFYGPPGRTEIVKFDIPPEQIIQPTNAFPDATRVILQVQLQIAGLPLHSEGTLEVTVETEREDDLRAGRLHVRIPGRPDPAAIDQGPATPSFSIKSVQPSEPPPSAAPQAKRRSSRKRR
jgi:hypothetical protein